jgi:hypothetical protein
MLAVVLPAQTLFGRFIFHAKSQSMTYEISHWAAFDSVRRARVLGDQGLIVVNPVGRKFNAKKEGVLFASRVGLMPRNRIV